MAVASGTLVCYIKCLALKLWCFSLWCRGALDKFLLAPKPQGWWENPPAVRRGTFWVLGPSSDISLPPNILYFLFCHELPYAGSQGVLFGCTHPWQSITRGFCRGWMTRVGIREQLFSITDGLQRQKKSLLSFLLPPWIKKEEKSSLRKKGCLWSTD